MSRANPHRAAGFALGTAVLVLLLVTLALAIAATHLALRQRLLREDGERVALVALADAGLAEALAELAADPSFAGFAPAAWGVGTLGSDVSGGGARRRVVVVAEVRGRQRRVAAIVELPVAPETFPPRIESWELLPSEPTASGGVR